MERLTGRGKAGEGLPIKHLNLMHMDTASVDTLTNILDRLAEYEDTGLEPDEVKELEEKYNNDEHEYCGEYGTEDCQFAHKLDKVKKELDCWKREAISDKAKLGELRIWMGNGGTYKEIPANDAEQALQTLRKWKVEHYGTEEWGMYGDTVATCIRALEKQIAPDWLEEKIREKLEKEERRISGRGANESSRP